jgi:cytoskeletal protein CcmA (bactofilin family)
MVEMPRSASDESGTKEFATILGSDATFKGELAFQGGVRIDGAFEGSITTPGKVFVSREGRVKAEIKAGTLVVEGQVEGNAAVKERVELRATCRYTGDLKAGKLQVLEGASFAGRCEVGAGALSTATAGAATPEHAAPGMDPAGMRPAVAVGPRR